MITVKTICDKTPGGVRFMDNGNGATVFSGTPEGAIDAGFGSRAVNYITAENRCHLYGAAPGGDGHRLQEPLPGPGGPGDRRAAAQEDTGETQITLE